MHFTVTCSHFGQSRRIALKCNRAAFGALSSVRQGCEQAGRFRNLAASVAMCLAIAPLATVYSYADEQPANAPGVDQRLLDGLDEPKPLRPKPAADVPGEDLGAAQPKSTLASLARHMQSVEQRIRGRDTSESTQQLQRDIAGQLAKMLEAAEKNQESQANSAASSETTSQETSGADKGDQGNSTSPNRNESDGISDAVNAVWGALPAQLRQQIQSPLQEDFLPRYERVIKEYYRRVAEQQQSLRD